MADKLLVTAIEDAHMLSMGRSTFWRAVSAGMLPQPVRIGGLSALVNQSSLTEGLLSTPVTLASGARRQVCSGSRR